MHRPPAVPEQIAVAFADAALDVEWPDRPGTGRARDRFAGSLAARRAAATALRFDRIDRVELLRDPGRAPRAIVVGDGERRDAGLALSLSHCAGRAAAVAAPRGPRVGIDLERAGRVDSAHHRLFLTAAERRAARHHDGVALWTLKEAAWKALELGPDVPFTDVELDFDGGGSVCGVRHFGRSISARAVVSRPWPGFVLAVLWTECTNA